MVLTPCVSVTQRLQCPTVCGTEHHLPPLFFILVCLSVNCTPPPHLLAFHCFFVCWCLISGLSDFLFHSIFTNCYYLTVRLIPWGRGSPEKLTGPQVLKNLHAFCGTPEGSLSHSHKPTTRPYPKPVGSNPSCHHAPLLSPICGTCSACLSLLELTTRMVFGEEYRA